MRLHSAVTQYVTYRRTLGEKFISNGNILKAFARSVGQDKNLWNIQEDQVNAYLVGNGPITIYWHKKHQALRGFYRYVISRGYTKTSPLPAALPKLPQSFVPYIYDVKELRVILETTFSYQKKRGQLEPYMVRTLLLLLYGAGLRNSEAIDLKIADVDLVQKLLTIRETKFNKTRLVPIGDKLTQALSKYALQRQQEGYSQNLENPFFVGRNGKAVNQYTLESAFQVIREKAGVKRTDNARYQPRLHDLRHTFAVHRLTEWYKNGADVQRLLPVLSVYLGHTHLAATSVYLTMTPALLDEAGRRFQQYAFKEESHD